MTPPERRRGAPGRRPPTPSSATADSTRTGQNKATAAVDPVADPLAWAANLIAEVEDRHPWGTPDHALAGPEDLLDGVQELAVAVGHLEPVADAVVRLALAARHRLDPVRDLLLLPPETGKP